MTAVRFLYTSQPGKGFEELINPDQQLKNWLRDNLRQPHSPSYTRTLDKGLSVSLQDGWVICTYLVRQTDDNNRPFIRNHSLLAPESEYIHLAKNFDQTILANITEDDERALLDGQLKPLAFPQSTGGKLALEDMKVVTDYFGQGQDLEKLLASLIGGNPFSLTMRGTTDDAIYLACALLKAAAQEDMPVPQFATFEPNSKTRSWYPSQVLPSPRLRVNIQFHQRNSPNKEAVGTASRLARSFVNLDSDGLAASMLTATNHAEVMRYSTTATISTPAANESRKGEGPLPDGSDDRIYQINKEYEVALNKRKEEHDREFSNRQEELYKLKEELDSLQEELDYQKRTLSDKERTLEEDRALVRETGAKRARWRHIERIFEVLEMNNYQELERLVLSRFFDQLKNLDQDALQVLQTEVDELIPGLQKIAEFNEAEKATFLKDLESIDRKLEGKGSRWGLPWSSSRNL